MNAQTFSMMLGVVKADPLTPRQAAKVQALMEFESITADEKLVSKKTAAELLNCHPNTVDNLSKRGVLNPVYSGRRPQFRKTEIERLMTEGW